MKREPYFLATFLRALNQSSGKRTKDNRKDVMNILPKDKRHNRANAILIMDSQQRAAEFESGVDLV